MRCMGRNREISVVERKLQHISQVELGVVAQTRAGVGGRILTSGDPIFPAVQTENN